jgi:hypothetical protein
MAAPIVFKKIDLCDNRADYFVCIRVGDREVTPHVFRKAAYHVALYDWLLNGNGESGIASSFSLVPARASASQWKQQTVRAALIRRLSVRNTCLEGRYFPIQPFLLLG